MRQETPFSVADDRLRRLKSGVNERAFKRNWALEVGITCSPGKLRSFNLLARPELRGENLIRIPCIPGEVGDGDRDGNHGSAVHINCHPVEVLGELESDFSGRDSGASDLESQLALEKIYKVVIGSFQAGVLGVRARSNR